MLIDIDVADDRMISSPGVKDGKRLLEFKRDTSAEIEVRFWRDGVRVERADDAVGAFGIKATKKYDSETLVFAGAWVKTGAGETALYTFAPSLNGAALAALLGSGDDDENNDEDYIVAMCEIRWVESGKKHRTQTVAVTISNDVLKDLDGTPLLLETPDDWLSFRAVRFDTVQELDAIQQNQAIQNINGLSRYAAIPYLKIFHPVFSQVLTLRQVGYRETVLIGGVEYTSAYGFPLWHASSGGFDFAVYALAAYGDREAQWCLHNPLDTDSPLSQGEGWDCRVNAPWETTYADYLFGDAFEISDPVGTVEVAPVIQGLDQIAAINVDSATPALVVTLADGSQKKLLLLDYP